MRYTRSMNIPHKPIEIRHCSGEQSIVLIVGDEWGLENTEADQFAALSRFLSDHTDYRVGGVNIYHNEHGESSLEVFLTDLGSGNGPIQHIPTTIYHGKNQEVKRNG